MDMQPCLWVREERGIAYDGWPGEPIDHWACVNHHHRNIVRIRRGDERMVLAGYIQLDDLHDEYRRRPFWAW